MARALVTGAGKRIGRAMAIHLAARGHDVAVHYAASANAAAEVVDEIRAMGRKAVALQADLLVEAEAEPLVSRACDDLGGPLSFLVNNASIFEPDTIATATRESWDRHLGSNLRAPFILTQAFAAQAPAPLTDERGEKLAQALVVNMIDQRVVKPTPLFMTYTIAKMALWAFTQTAAQALAPQVRVNAIAPGPTMRGARQEEAHFRRQRQATILERGASAAEVSAALGYLMDAASVTGQMLFVDGGQHLGWRTPDILDTG